MTESEPINTNTAPGPRAGFTLTAMTELVISSSFVLAIVRSYLAAILSQPLRSDRLPIVIDNTARALVVGVGLAGGIGLLIETLRGQSVPARWSLGRWIWSVTSVYIILSMAWALFIALCVQWNHPGSLTTLESLYYAAQRFIVSNRSLVELPWVLVGLCFTANITQVLPGGSQDLREWVGRLYASLVVGMCMGVEMFKVFTR